MSKPWTLQDAKNKFSAVVNAAMNGEPQRVTRRGHDAVVVLASEEFDRLTGLAARAKPAKTFAEHLLNFPKLPEGMEDPFDFDERPQLVPRDIDL